MALFSLRAALGLDSSSFEAGLKRSQSLAVGFGREFKAAIAAAFTVGAVTAYTKKLLDLADNTKDVADQLNITTEEVQRLTYIADDSGVAFDKWAAAIGKVAAARNDALGDGEKAEKLRRLFERFGVTNADLANESVRAFDILKKLAASAGELSTLSQSQLTDLLGDKAFRLISSLGQLNADLPIQIISDEELKRIDDAAKKIKLLQNEVDTYASGMLAKTLGGYESNMRGRDPKLGPLAGLAAMMDTASEFIANAFGKTLEPDRKTAPADLEEALRKRQEARAANLAGGAATMDDMEWFDSFQKQKGQRTKAAKQDQFKRPDTGNLARIGGLYFGADYNARLYDLTQKIERHVARSAEANVTTATKLSE